MKSINKNRKNQKCMNKALFGDLMQSLDEALRYSQGEQINARITTLPAPTARNSIAQRSAPGRQTRMKVSPERAR